MLSFDALAFKCHVMSRIILAKIKRFFTIKTDKDKRRVLIFLGSTVALSSLGVKIYRLQTNFLVYHQAELESEKLLLEQGINPRTKSW